MAAGGGPRAWQFLTVLALAAFVHRPGTGLALRVGRSAVAVAAGRAFGSLAAVGLRGGGEALGDRGRVDALHDRRSPRLLRGRGLGLGIPGCVRRFGRRVLGRRLRAGILLGRTARIERREPRHGPGERGRVLVLGRPDRSVPGGERLLHRRGEVGLLVLRAHPLHPPGLVRAKPDHRVPALQAQPVAGEGRAEATPLTWAPASETPVVGQKCRSLTQRRVASQFCGALTAAEDLPGRQLGTLHPDDSHDRI